MKQLRRSIRICALILTIVVLLPMVYAAYSLLRYGTRWRTSEYNTYLRSMKSGVVAGDIRDRRGVLLASTRITADAEGSNTTQRIYAADEKVRRAVVHAVGDSKNNVKNAAESFLSEYLYGANMTYLERLTQTASGGLLRGDNVTLTIDSALSAHIASVFPEGKNGAVVVMNYRTGEIHALLSFPSYDPLSARTVTVSQALNRATRWLSAPGSTFKVITLAAALESLPGIQDRTFTCTGGLTFGEHQRPVIDYGGAAHGTLSLQNAFTRSCNSTFAILACEMGDKALRRTAQSFGLGDDFTFRDLVVENSSYAASSNALLGADLGWTGAGQHQLAVTPLHMCMAAAAVANGGIMMEPRLLLRADSATGIPRAAFEPAVYRLAMTPETARTIGEYMLEVTRTGTGTSASVSGLRICSKTGTAEIDTQSEDNAWYIGYIDDDQLPYAVCISIVEGGTGGSAAAPVAREVFRYLQQH